MKVTDAITPGHAPLFICDFSPPRGAAPELLADASDLRDGDFICVAYNPGKAVRVDSMSAAYYLKQTTGIEGVFNLSPRDMNKLAIESRLLGAQLLGLQNVLVVQGDKFTERDNQTSVADFTASSLVAAISQLNQGLDFKGLKLRAPTDLCIGASIDLGAGIEQQAKLTRRKLQAGAHFFVAQPVFETGSVRDFYAAYAELTGEPLSAPVFWGLQILVPDGVLFSNVPERLRSELAGGRDGVDMALETYASFVVAGIETVYLVSPIMRGGARDYAAARRFLSQVRAAT